MSSAKRSNGFILLARQLLESEVMMGPPLNLKLFVWMLLKANWKDSKETGLRRGQLIASIKKMQRVMTFKIGYRTVTPTRDEIRGAYGVLTKTGTITTTKTTRGMIITILNYIKYQASENYEPHTEAPTNSHTIRKEVIIEKNINIYCRPIVEHLNRKTGRNFKATTRKTQQLIRARLNEGFQHDDFIQVIDTKTAKWLNDETMSAYLRPETLFGTKFEGYLNEGKSATSKPHLLTREELERLTQ